MCFCPPEYFDLAAPNPDHILCRVTYLYIGLTLSDANIANGTPFFNSQNP